MTTCILLIRLLLLLLLHPGSSSSSHIPSHSRSILFFSSRLPPQTGASLSARATPIKKVALGRLSQLLLLPLLLASSTAAQVRVETTKPAPGNARVTKASSYDAMVTLSIEEADGKLTPSGWSTRKEHQGDGRPFSFQPGRNLIQGWTDGVLQMREGERALIHVPYALGYGEQAQGSKGGAWYIPGRSNLLFDIEILGKAGAGGPAPASADELR